LIHFGDLHVWRIGLDADLFPKRFLGLANLALRRGREFPPAVARAVAARLAEETADFLLFSGDLTTTALAAEFVAGRELLGPLFERWGERLIAIPGNHDRYTPRATRGRLFERLFLRREMNYPFSIDLDQRWTAVAFDCSVPRWLTSTGRLDPPRLDALRRVLRRERERGRELLVLGHYPAVYPPSVAASWDHSLPAGQRRALLKALQEHDVRLYLHGHKHRRWLLRADGLLHLNCGAAGGLGKTDDRRPGYLKIKLGEGSEPTIEAHYLTSAGVEEGVGPGQGQGQVWRQAPLTELVFPD
jgi:3',5'-cyclic AMP phosphodiesterase CpdA